MKKNRTYKLLLHALWVGITIGIFVVLAGAVRSEQSHRIDQIIITRKGLPADSQHRVEIMQLIGAYVDKSINEMAIHDIPLNRLEGLLVAEDWIDDAHLFIDNANTLHVSLDSRQPIARIFDINGKSYFLDQQGQHFSINHMKQQPVVLFSSVPGMQKEDSAVRQTLYKDIVQISEAIRSDSFWMAQTDQIEYTKTGYKLHPVLGNHMIWLGDADDMPAKLLKLKIFYKEVLSVAGLNAYPVINAAFKNQIVVQQQLASGQQVQQAAVSNRMEKMAIRNRSIAEQSAIANEQKSGRLMEARTPEPAPPKKVEAQPVFKQKPADEAKPKQPKALMPKPSEQ